MAGTLEGVIDAAARLDGVGTPARRQRLALQHLHLDACARAFGAPGGRWSSADAAAAVGQVAVRCAEDLTLGGPVAAPAAAAARVHARDEAALLRGALAGVEVGGRVALALLLAADRPAAGAAARAAAAAAAAGVALGARPDELQAAVGLALSAGASGPDAATRAGLDAATAAVGGARPSAPAERSLERLAPALLRPAFTAVGEAWLIDTLWICATPVAAGARVGVEAVHEVLRRHLKAADKRLRADQVDAVDLRIGLPLGVGLSAEGRGAAAVSRSAPLAVGLLLAAHGLDLPQLDDAALAARAEQVEALAQRVRVTVDPVRGGQALRAAWSTVGPLFAELGPRELSAARGALQARAGGGLRLLARAAAADPRWALRQLRRADPDLRACAVDQWQPRLPVEVILHTTRGGAWPERRDLPEGAPGASWAQAQARVLERVSASGDPRARAAAEGALAGGPVLPALGG